MRRLIPFLIFSLLLSACGQPTATPTVTVSPLPVSEILTRTATLAPSVTPSATASNTPSAVPTATNTATFAPPPFLPTDCPTLTPTPTSTITPVVSSTPTTTPTGTATGTPTSTATVTATPDPNATPTPTITPGPSKTPTITPTPTRTLTPTPTITWTPHPCPSPTPTATLSPTPSLTPTPTPALPPLAELLLTSEDVEAIDPDFWTAPPEDFTADLKRTSSQCTVDCIGLRWTSADRNSKLTLLIYRTPDFNQAIASAVGAQAFYLQRGYTELEIPPGGTLPAFSWAGTLENKDLVIITSQGPAVVTLFWQNIVPGDIEPMLKSLSLYAGIQAGTLRSSGFLTATRQLTPFP